MSSIEAALRGVADGAISLAELRSILADAQVFVSSPAATEGGDLGLPIVELQGGGSAVPLFSSHERQQEAAVAKHP